MQREKLVEKLDAKRAGARVRALTKIVKKDKKEGTAPTKIDFAAMNVRTAYSGSPYSPSAAVYMAYNNGLSVCGILDHADLSGAEEFAAAADAADLGYSIGVQITARSDKDFYKTAVYGIGLKKIKEFREFLLPVRGMFEDAIEEYIQNLNKLFAPLGVKKGFAELRDGLGCFSDGIPVFSYVCRRYIETIIAKTGAGQPFLDALSECGVVLDEKRSQLLVEAENPYYCYDAAEVLHDATELGSEKFPELSQIQTQAVSMGGFASCMLNDDTATPNMLKKVKQAGFLAVNIDTSQSADKIAALEEEANRLEIMLLPSNIISTPRRKFGYGVTGEALRESMMNRVWAVVGHQRMVNADIRSGMFSEQALTHSPSLAERIKLYSVIGRQKNNLR